VSDTPIAEQLAAALELPWPLRRSWRIDGHLYEQPEGLSVPSEKQSQQMQDLIKHMAAQGDVDGAVDMAVILDGAEASPPPDPPQ
jgi:hypothetical protein